MEKVGMLVAFDLDDPTVDGHTTAHAPGMSLGFFDLAIRTCAEKMDAVELADSHNGKYCK